MNAGKKDRPFLKPQPDTGGSGLVLQTGWLHWLSVPSSLDGAAALAASLAAIMLGSWNYRQEVMLT